MNKDISESPLRWLALAFMFAFGWLASDCVTAMSKCDSCETVGQRAQRYEQRLGPERSRDYMQFDRMPQNDRMQQRENRSRQKKNKPN